MKTSQTGHTVKATLLATAVRAHAGLRLQRESNSAECRDDSYDCGS